MSETVFHNGRKTAPEEIGPVWAEWFGGSSYAMPEHAERVEFPTLAAAITEHDDAYRGHGFGPNGLATPCVDERSTTIVYLYDPAQSVGDPYPDFLIECQRDEETGEPDYDHERDEIGPVWVVAPC